MSYRSASGFGPGAVGPRRSAAVLAAAMLLALACAFVTPAMLAAQEAAKPSARFDPPTSPTAFPPTLGGLDALSEGISANPGAVNVLTGTGSLGEALGFGPQSGVRIGGLWIGDANYLFAGGVEPRSWAFDSLLLVDLSLDFDRLLHIPGAQFGVEFLQFNADDANAEAGSVTGYNSLPGPPPLNRTELYELWWRQSLFDDRLILRVGKSVTTAEFNNVVPPLPLHDDTLAIPAVSSLIYTPIFVNATLLGAMPGFYNSAYGVTTIFAPTHNLYLALGTYDGNLARGVQTGIRLLPEFNGYYFNVGEIGYAWHRPPHRMPGTMAVGAWRQTGELRATTAGGSELAEDGAGGIYTFGSQRVWVRNPGVDNSGVIAFFQFGANASETLPVKTYFGTGLTGFGLVPGRPQDAMGVGVAVSWLNSNLGFRDSETLLAAYYQIEVVDGLTLQPTLTYIPNPGLSPSLSPATALTVRLTRLF